MFAVSILYGHHRYFVQIYGIFMNEPTAYSSGNERRRPCGARSHHQKEFAEHRFTYSPGHRFAMVGLKGLPAMARWQIWRTKKRYEYTGSIILYILTNMTLCFLINMQKNPDDRGGRPDCYLSTGIRDYLMTTLVDLLP